MDHCGARINSNDSQKSRLLLHIVCWEESGGAEFLSQYTPPDAHANYFGLTRLAILQSCARTRIFECKLDQIMFGTETDFRMLSANLFMGGIWHSFFRVLSCTSNPAV